MKILLTCSYCGSEEIREVWSKPKDPRCKVCNDVMSIEKYEPIDYYAEEEEND